MFFILANLKYYFPLKLKKVVLKKVLERVPVLKKGRVTVFRRVPLPRLLIDGPPRQDPSS